MGIGATELTLEQLAAYKYQNVNFINLPGGSLLYTVVGHPNMVIINIGEFLNITDGEIQGDAIALDELGAAQIGDSAVTGRELAAVGSLFDAASKHVTVIERDWNDGDAHELLAANGAGAGDRLLLVQAFVTEAFDLDEYTWIVGSAADDNGLFEDLFAGDIDIGLRESVMSAYILPAAEALVLTESSQTDGTGAGKVTFHILDLGAIVTARLPDDAVTDAKILSEIVKDPGRIAVGLVDFNAEGTENCVITVGVVTYPEEHDATDVTLGEWDNGGAAAASATNLAAGINGDTRNASGPSYAAIAADTTVWIFALDVGAAGNVGVASDQAEPDVAENLVGGLDAVVREVVLIEHVVTAEEATQVEAIIPLPFDPTHYSFQVLDANGEDKHVSDRGTVTVASDPVPCYFKLITNGATHIAATDIIKLVAQE